MRKKMTAAQRYGAVLALMVVAGIYTEHDVNKCGAPGIEEIAIGIDEITPAQLTECLEELGGVYDGEGFVCFY